ALEHDVADESVRHDHFHAIGEKVVAFDIADEIQVGEPAKPGGFAGQLRAFAFLGAVAEDADAGRLAPEQFARVDRAHDGELDQLRGLALVVGAGVDEDELAAAGGDDDGDGGPVDGIETVEFEGGGGD